MSFPSQEKIDVIATQILLDAKQALTTLRGWNNSIEDGQQKMRLFKELIKSTASQMNGDFKAATAAVAKFSNALNINPAVVRKIGKDLQAIDKIAQQSLAGMSQRSMEGTARMTLLSNAIQAMAVKGKVSIDQVTSSLRTLNSSVGTRFGKLGFSDADISKAGEAARQTATQLKQAGEAGEKAGKKTESAFQRTFSAINAARLALGVLISMILFQAIQAVQNFFREAIEQATKFEDTLYRLQNAERALSMEGVEVSLSGLKAGITEIQKLLPIFSKEDIASLVGTLAVSTKQLKLNEQQILDLAKAIGILNIRSEKQEDIQTTAQHVLSSLLTGNAKGISALGIAFTDNTMRAKAMELGFLKAGESLAELSENEKGLTKLQLLLDSTGQEMQGIGEYLDTNSAKLQENKAAWADLQTTVGQILLPFVPALTSFFQLINDGFTVGKVVIIEFLTILGAIGTVGAAVLSGQITNIKQFTEAMKIAVDTIRTSLTNTFFKGVPDDAPEWFKRGWGDRIKADAETATGAINNMYDAAEDSEEAEKALADIEEKIQDIILDAKQAREDLDLRLKQKEQDLDTEYERKREDAARDHAQKLVDIDLDARRKAEDAKSKLREDEKKAEQDLLQKLKELRERFLLDLEDALHARDARQVLRLIKEYKLEKQNILDRKKLDDQQRKDRLAEDLKAIELERQRRIENENVEYQRKLSDLATAKAREQEELRLWYQREQDDIQRNIEQKLQKLIAGYIAEGKIHESEQARIYGILAKYFAKDMALVDSLAQFMASRFAQVSQLASMQYPVNAPYSTYGQMPQTTTQKAKNDPLFQRHNFAEGGTLIATRPTVAMFGENGPERADFTPLSRHGRDVGKLFGDVEGGGVNGQILVSVDLSPDLEGRIVNRSMDGVAEVVGRVNRRKQ